MKWLPFLLTASTAISSSAAPLTEGPHSFETSIMQAVSINKTGYKENLIDILITKEQHQTMLEEAAAAAKAAAIAKAEAEKAAKEQARLLNANLKRLKEYVGRTPYVFSGVTPSGWDCSGLTLWFYQETFNIKLEHSASTQANLGRKVVDAPIPGDIVAFYYKGRTNAYHVGIYIGNDEFIHAPKPNERTTIDNVYTWANNTEVAYIRY